VDNSVQFDEPNDPPGAPPRASVLVLDDDVDHCMALGDVLREADYRVDLAFDARQAFERLAAEPRPDLILLDLMMPETDGWAFMARRRGDPMLRDIPVVVMSAGGDAVLVRAPVASGYLVKPIDRQQLLQTLERCLTMRVAQAARAAARRTGS
jgi:putative two-component system response regulator